MWSVGNVASHDCLLKCVMEALNKWICITLYCDLEEGESGVTWQENITLYRVEEGSFSEHKTARCTEISFAQPNVCKSHDNTTLTFNSKHTLENYVHYYSRSNTHPLSLEDNERHRNPRHAMQLYSSLSICLCMPVLNDSLITLAQVTRYCLPRCYARGLTQGGGAGGGAGRWDS